MINRQGLFATLALLVFCGAAATYAAEEKADKAAASATGTWKWTFTMRDGQTRDMVVKLTQAGEKLTGVYVGRDDQQTPIENGQVKEGEVSFTISREFNDRKFVSKYKGKLNSDTIKGTIETEFNGQSRSREWEAKLEKPLASGTWKWSITRQDGSTLEFALKLKQEGEKLTGVSIFNNGPEVAIEEGKATGKDIAFAVSGERDGNKWTSRFEGQIDGDTLKGKVTAKWGDQERTFDWEAKRAKD